MREGTVGVGGGRASLSSQGSLRVAQVSPSSEARFGGSVNSFSSKNIPPFNRQIISPKPYSIFNINRGSERSPKTAVSQSLRLKKDMVDTSRRISPERHVVSSEYTKKIENRVRVSFPVERQNTHINQTKMIRFNLPQREKTIFNFGKNTVTRFEKWNSRIPKKNLSADVSQHRGDQIKQIKKEVVLLGNSQDRMFVNRHLNSRSVHEAFRIPLELNHKNNNNNFAKKGERQGVKVKKMNDFREKGKELDFKADIQKIKTQKRVKFSRMIGVHSDVNANTTALIRKDIKDAKKIIPLIITTRKVSYEVAQKEALNLLLKKHEGKLFTRQIASLDQEKSRGKKVQNISITSRIKSEDKIYFERDIRANNAREDRAVLALDHLLRNRKEDDSIPRGSDIASVVAQLDQEVKSEVKTGLIGDGSFKEFVYEVSKLGELKNTLKLKEMVKEIITKITAVKLTSKISHLSASHADAERVYESSLQGVKGYFKEKDFLLGEFKTRTDGVIIYEAREKGLSVEVE